MKVGDLIRYRSRKAGDVPINEVASNLRGWGEHGIILKICEDSFGWDYNEPAVDYMTANGDIVRARQSDLEVIKK